MRSKACSVALESAYENMVMTGKFPACVLMLEMPPDTLDVNIHPAKAEVRFSDEKKVTNAIYFALKNAMLGAGLIYDFQMPKKDWSAGAFSPAACGGEKAPRTGIHAVRTAQGGGAVHTACHPAEAGGVRVIRTAEGRH